MDTISESPTETSVRPSPRSRSRRRSNRDYGIGIGLLFTVVFLWTSSNFLTQNLFETGYEKPFLVTFLNTSSFTLYLVAFFVRRRWAECKGAGKGSEQGSSAGEYEPLATNPERTVDEVADMLPLTTEETAKLALVFCYVWFIANWLSNACLGYTHVANATILLSMSGFFTLAVGRICRVETLTVSKIVALLTSFSGVVLVAFSDSSHSKPSTTPVNPEHELKPLLGDALAILSAVMFAFYVILLKVRVREESRIDMQLFFGFVGLFNILSCWVFGVVLHFTAVERFELPTTGKEVVALLINVSGSVSIPLFVHQARQMSITLTSDFIYVLAMLKTTPLVVTVGLSLNIPLAVVGDFFLLGKRIHVEALMGGLLVLGSFVMIGLGGSEEESAKDLLDNDLIGGHGQDDLTASER